MDNSVSNCIIGGDENTDISRICSENTISLQKFVAEENFSLALSTEDNSVKHTYRGVNNSTSLFDHLIVSDSIHKKISEYYTNDSVDNLSDHIPLFINFQCIVESVPNNPRPVMHSKPVWGLAQPDHIQKYQDKLNELLYNFLPTYEMFISSVNANHHFTAYLDNPSDRRLKLESIDEATTRKLIEHLKNKTSTGVDGISNKLLKISINELVTPVTIIINQMLNNGIFPEQLKISKVVPIYKANDQKLLTHYRPIALLPSISKIFEYAILEQLSNYFL